MKSSVARTVIARYESQDASDAQIVLGMFESIGRRSLHSSPRSAICLGVIMVLWLTTVGFAAQAQTSSAEALSISTVLTRPTPLQNPLRRHTAIHRILRETSSCRLRNPGAHSRTYRPGAGSSLGTVAGKLSAASIFLPERRASHWAQSGHQEPSWASEPWRQRSRSTGFSSLTQ